MSRHGYSDDCYDQWANIRWRGQVASAIRGKRGQAFLRELLCALEAMPEKRLISRKLVENGQVCALGSVGVARGIKNLAEIDPSDHETLSETFDIARQLVQEIEWENDEGCADPESRWQKMHAWATLQLRSLPESK